MDITCPHCRQTLEGDASLIGQTVTCPGCKQTFTVPKLMVDTPSPIVISSVRTVKKSRGGKWTAIGIPLAVLFLFGGILGRKLLRDSVGQHPEDGDSQVVLDMEVRLIMDYCEVSGEDVTQNFLQTVWTEERSDRERHAIVPWSCLELTAKARQWLRADQLAHRFRQAAQEYDLILERRADALAFRIQEDRIKRMANDPGTRGPAQPTSPTPTPPPASAPAKAPTPTAPSPFPNVNPWTGRPM